MVGYLHAKKRIRKGLPPLAYHRVSLPFVFPPLSITPNGPSLSTRIITRLKKNNPTNTRLSLSLQWLISRSELARVDPRYAFPQSSYTTYRPEYANQQQYHMQGNMPPPPPMYDPSGRPPMYDGPAGGTKTAPSQWAQEPTHRPGGAAGQDEEYGAPSGPPPPPTAHVQQPEHTGSTNPYRQ